tara:strand:+ start:122 stop:409 length:288 start_codon:yes stop_codon:yes gene_type:complete
MNKGFHVEFDNGLTFSVQFGSGNYCDNRNEEFTTDGYKMSSNAEIAVWDKEGNFCKLSEYDDVAGYIPVDDVFDHIQNVRKMPSGTNGNNWNYKA